MPTLIRLRIDYVHDNMNLNRRNGIVIQHLDQFIAIINTREREIDVNEKRKYLYHREWFSFFRIKYN
jgi:hypothetical protein